VTAAAITLTAAGLALTMLPRVPGVADAARRLVSLALVIAGWAWVATTLLPEGARDDLGDLLSSPAGLAATAAVVVVGLGAAWLLAMLLIARPWIWFVLLALALPVRLPVSVGGESANLLVPLYAVILIGLAAYLIGALRGRLPRAPASPAPAVDLLLAALAGFLVLSGAWSADPDEAAVKIVFFYVPFSLLYLLVIAWWPHARALRTLTLTTLTMAVPVALLALWQYASRDIFWNETLMQANVYSRFYRVNAIFFDPNILGRYLVLGLIAVVAIAWVASRRRDLLVLAAVATVLAAALVVTYSRSSALMLMVAMALLAWRAFGPRRTLAAGAVLVLAFGGIAVASSGPVRHALTSTDRLEHVSEGRFDLMRGGLTIWREQPIVGSGLGSFAERYRETLTPTEQRRTRVVISHNAPVTVLSETGVVGFALFVLTLVVGARRIVRTSRTGGDSGWFQWALLAALAGILVHTLLYSAFFEDPYVWVAAAAALTLGAATRAGEPAA
jgi:putative inorganic carbon (HCO3(-)) transporter